MAVAFLVAFVYSVVVPSTASEVTCNTIGVSAGDESSFLQVHPPQQVRSSLDTDSNCTVSTAEDAAIMTAYIEEHTNESLIERYKDEGKISENGFPILQMVHIAKNAGIVMHMSGAPLGKYGFGLTNEAYVFGKKVKTMKQLSKSGSEPGGCFVEQAPPMYLEPSYADWVYGESEVFCAARDPFSRAISSACHQVQYEDHVPRPPSCNCFPGDKNFPHNCNLDITCIDEKIQNSITAFQTDRLHEQCHWCPQTHFLQGKHGCKHVLDMDNLESEFNGLMMQNGMSEVKLATDYTGHECARRCNFTKNDLSSKTIKMMEDVYSEDFKLWDDLRRNRSIDGPLYGR